MLVEDTTYNSRTPHLPDKSRQIISNECREFQGKFHCVLSFVMSTMRSSISIPMRASVLIGFREARGNFMVSILA